MPLLVLATALSAAWNGLSFVAAAELAGTARSGAAIGFQQTVLSVSGVVVPPLFATLVAFSSWRAGFALAALAPLAGLGAARPRAGLTTSQGERGADARSAIPSARSQPIGIWSSPKSPKRSIAAPIASWPAISSPIVAAAPIRGVAKVIDRITISPMTPAAQSQSGARKPSA